MVKAQSSHSKYSLGPKATLVLLVAVVLFVLMLSSVVDLFIKYRAIRRHIAELEEEQSALVEKKSALNTTNQFIATPEGKEQIFRDKYRLVRPGEGMIVITKDEPAAPPASRSPGFTRFWDSIMQGLGLR